MNQVLKKPSWDGRQDYVKLLMERLKEAGDLLNAGDYRGAYHLYDRLFNQVKPWVMNDDALLIASELRQIERRLPASQRRPVDNWEQYRRQQLDRRMSAVESHITEAAKHLMLPANTDIDETDIDFTKLGGFN